MSDTTSKDEELLKLCKEVYKRFPEWNDLRDWWWGNHIKGGGITYDFTPNAPKDKIGRDDIPLYTSDYLLEKLLPKVSIKFATLSDGQIGLFYSAPKPDYADYKADTPLKALLKLIVALDNAGVKL